MQTLNQIEGCSNDQKASQLIICYWTMAEIPISFILLDWSKMLLSIFVMFFKVYAAFCFWLVTDWVNVHLEFWNNFYQSPFETLFPSVPEVLTRISEGIFFIFADRGTYWEISLEVSLFWVLGLWAAHDNPKRIPRGGFSHTHNSRSHDSCCKYGARSPSKMSPGKNLKPYWCQDKSVHVWALCRADNEAGPETLLGHRWISYHSFVAFYKRVGHEDVFIHSARYGHAMSPKG